MPTSFDTSIDLSSFIEQFENLLDSANSLYNRRDEYEFGEEIKEDFQEMANEIESSYFEKNQDEYSNQMEAVYTEEDEDSGEMSDDFQETFSEGTTDTFTQSDAGTPLENSAIPADTDDGDDIDKLDFGSEFSNPNGMDSSDWAQPTAKGNRLVGGEGANTFEFNPLINAKPEIYEKHINEDGTIDWKGVAGENDNYHDHWVDSIGNDEIADFSGNGGEGDEIKIVGHTVAVEVLEELDNQASLGIYSDQGGDGNRGDGAHDFDVIGTVEVNHDGNFDFDRDVSVDPNVFDGAFATA